MNVALVPIWGPGGGDASEGGQDIPTATELYSVLDFPKKKKHIWSNLKTLTSLTSNHKAT